MADTWRENAIVLAILIIADKKIAQAGYDKTIKGLINRVIDSASGKYLIKYQDSLFEAYATSSKITYNKDLEVSVLIPGNDWDRVKTILNSINSNANNYKQVPIVSDSYNIVGPNGSSLTLEIQLSSYISLSKVLLDGQGISFDDISNYIKKGNAIALGMKIRTAFADGQIGGRYGLNFNLVFKDDVNNKLIIKTYTVSNMDVIGHPYQLINSQWVLTLITGIDTENFVRISSIEAYCDGFPLNENKADIKDIFISDIKINGADVLSDLDLNGSILHIDCSTNGDTLKDDITELPLIAQLKINGKITTLNVVYYWFRLNGTIFRGNEKYSGYVGDGWECLNYKDGNSFVPKTVNTFTFNSTEDDLVNNSALVPQKIIKILCVAVYDNRDWIKGLILLNNNFINNDIIIRIKDGLVYTDKTVYFLDNGQPDLVCETNLEGSLEYIWSVKPARGRAEQIIENDQITQEVAAAVFAWELALTKRDWMAPASARDFVLTDEYINAKNNFEQALITPYVSGNTYYNFPISSIIGYSTISCAVKLDGYYKGTASVVLYNKTQLEGMYSLNLEHGTQVFQYDGKGNSPTSPQLERKLEIQPLSFNLINNDGLEIPYDQIINNGYVKWIIPNTQTLLKSNQSEEHVTGELDITVTRTDLPLAAKDYDVYFNLSQFSYSIEDQYDLKKNINYIWLHVNYEDMLFDAYTNFTFPKDGDPGTNGTDFVAKIIPVGEDSLFIDTDRIYISDKELGIFDDSGSNVDKLKFLLYNNSRIIENADANYWNCPPTLFSNNNTDKRVDITTYLQKSNGIDGWSKPELKVSGKTCLNILGDKPVNIIRGQYNSEDELRYFAEYPICTLFVKSGYRLKIRPKSGFKYVVYLEDGTRPDYDNTLPFEIIILKINLETTYWEIVQDDIECTWYAIGNIEPETLTGKSVNFKPKDTFDGSDLNSAIVVNVPNIGCLHVPIYMILNRYGHSALNGWDGNSIQLNANGDTILAPQIGAGKKLSEDNTFTGILMGDVKTASSTDTGIMGYDHGIRSIFMDAETGKTVLGKQGAGQITIDPRNNTARIYSGNYSTTAGTGMEIDLTDPHIQFGSGHFSVNNLGNITAKGGGTIAGWKISDDALTSNNNQVYLRSQNYTTSNPYAIYSNGTFTVTPNGFLHSVRGDIAGWTIDDNTLSKGGVTINSDNSNASNYAFRANNNAGTRKFSVDYNGNLYSRAGDIAGWTILEGQLSKKDASNNLLKLSPTTGISIVKGSDNSKKFTVNNEGYLTSTSGKIGGWNITGTELWAVGQTGENGIRIDSTGSLTGGKASNSTAWNTDSQGRKTSLKNGGSWAINSDGSSTFKNITVDYLKASNVDVEGDIYANYIKANTAGTIGGWTISQSQLTGGNLILDSSGAMSGPGWSISSSGVAKFANGQGSFSAGGGSGVNGGFSCGASGGGAWGGPAATMQAKTITLYTSLGLSRVSSGSNSTNPGWRIPTSLTTYTAPTGVKENSHGWTKMVQGTISGQTNKGDSITGSCTIYIPIYELDYTNGPQYTVIDNATNIGTTLVTGWNLSNTKTATYDFLCSGNPNQETKQDG